MLAFVAWVIGTTVLSTKATLCWMMASSSSLLSPHSVWIVGGGFAGLSAAAALRRIAGVPHVTILEQSDADDYYGDDSPPAAASQLGPNGLRALQRIGGDELLDKLLRDGDALTHVGVMVAPSTVMLIPDTSMEDTGKPQLLIQWKVLRRHLQDLLPKESIHTSAGRGVCGYKRVDTHDGPSILLLDRNGDEVPGGVEAPAPSLLITAGM